jgi:predicted transcriptional regulator of viral defense system
MGTSSPPDYCGGYKEVIKKASRFYREVIRKASRFYNPAASRDNFLGGLQS